METKLEHIQTLLQFKNQQAVLNFYEEDELIQREGIRFEIISVDNDQLLFKKGEQILFALSLEKYTSFKQRNDFKHYYWLENGETRVEIYFP